MEVKPTTAEHITQLFDSHDEVYPMTSPRGRVLIIHNEEFDEAVNMDQNSLDDRYGSELDLTNLELLFKSLDFIVVPLFDLNAQRMLDRIREETKHPDHEKYGMFIMVILSHGDEGVIYGSDSRKVSINDITRRLSVKNFPAMADKPKMVIIQACAGGRIDSELQHDNQEKEATRLPTRARVVKSTVSDFVIMQASYPGFKSFRDSLYGTFLIQALIDVLRDYSCHENIQELVVRVRNKVLEMCEEFSSKNIGAQTVHSSETLRKKLYFFPGMSGPASTEPNRAPQTAAALVHLAGDAEVTTSNLLPAPPSARAAASSNLPPTPPSARASVRLAPLMKLRHLETISTPNACWTVTLNPNSQVLHGGQHYDSLNGAQYGAHIDCIRSGPDNELFILERNDTAKTAYIVTYKLGKKPTLIQKLVSKVTSNRAYMRISKLQVQYCDYRTDFTKMHDLLILTGANSGKLYFYQYSTGSLIREVTHPDMKWPRGIFHDTNTSAYLTDYRSDSIFNITLNDDQSPSIIKLNCRVVCPMAIATHGGCLLVLSAIEPKPELHILTTRGEKLTTLELPECRGRSVCDIGINTRGVVAIANYNNGVQLYEFQ